MHRFAYDPAAIDVPAAGNPVSEKYRQGAVKCTVCRCLLSFCLRFGTYADGCSGPVPATGGTGLGTDLDQRAGPDGMGRAAAVLTGLYGRGQRD